MVSELDNLRFPDPPQGWGWLIEVDGCREEATVILASRLSGGPEHYENVRYPYKYPAVAQEYLVTGALRLLRRLETSNVIRDALTVPVSGI